MIIDFALCAAARSNDFGMLRLQLQVHMWSHSMFSYSQIKENIFARGCLCS
jgi:hypothetical protein